mgnify:CR=1 FL=1
MTSCSLVTWDGTNACGSGAFTSTDVTIDSSYDITVKRNVELGYGPHTFCYKCTSSKQTAINHGSDAAQVLEYKFSIQQVMNCDKTLTIKAQGGAGVPLLTKEYTYASSPATVVFAAGYTSFFAHADVTNCPITSCALMTSNCATSLPANANFKLTDGNTPYGITATQNVVDGWTKPVAFGPSTFVEYCYKCSGTKYEGGTYFKQ